MRPARKLLPEMLHLGRLHSLKLSKATAASLERNLLLQASLRYQSKAFVSDAEKMKIFANCFLQKITKPQNVTNWIQLLQMLQIDVETCIRVA